MRAEPFVPACRKLIHLKNKWWFPFYVSVRFASDSSHFNKIVHMHLILVTKLDSWDVITVHFTSLRELFGRYPVGQEFKSLSFDCLSEERAVPSCNVPSHTCTVLHFKFYRHTACNFRDTQQFRMKIPLSWSRILVAIFFFLHEPKCNSLALRAIPEQHHPLSLHG